MEMDMTFQEIVSSQGVTQEQYSIMIKEMTKNRIFLTKEEKIEERYLKLRLKKEELRSRLEQSVVHISELQRLLKEKEKLLLSYEARERLATSSKVEYESMIADLIISSALKQKLSDTRYPELLVEKFDKSKLSINSSGMVEGIEEQLAALRITYQELFPDNEKEEVECVFPRNEIILEKGYPADLERMI